MDGSWKSDSKPGQLFEKILAQLSEEKKTTDLG